MSKVLTRSEIDRITKDLRDKAEVDENLEIIKDNILHFEDQDGIIINNFSRSLIYLQVKYMRKTKRTAMIELPIEDDDGDDEDEFIGDPEKISLRYSNSINNFLEYLSISDRVYLIVNYGIEFGKIQDPRNFFNAILYLENICKIEGISLSIGDNHYFSSERETIFYDGRWMGEKTPTDYRIERVISHRHSYTFRFTKSLDPKKFKTETDPLDVLPNSIIDDFKKFAQKLNMKRSDKSELVNLLSKADWNKKDVEKKEN